jgi:hypothetical protein
MKGEIMATDDLRLDGVSAAREVPVLLLLLQRLLRLFVLQREGDIKTTVVQDTINNDEGSGSNGNWRTGRSNLGELPADCAGLLWSKVKREVLLALVVFA